MIAQTRFFIVSVFLFHIIFSAPPPINLNETIPLDIVRYNNVAYISLSEWINTHQLYSNYYETKDKLEIIYNKHKLYFSPGMSYCKINDKIYNLVYTTINKKNVFYVPANFFYKLLKATNMPFRIVKETKDFLYVIKNFYNVHSLSINSKQNGILLKLNTTQTFQKSEISSSISSANWLNITILNGVLDSININTTLLSYPVSKIHTMQSKESAQISLLLNIDVEDIDVDIGNQQINFLLRNAIMDNAEKINELRKKWFIDTIVIDAGHGGKDPGALGYQLKEKNITREEDVFVPLWKRTKIANSAEGKLFISIHVNSTSKSTKTYGYETYLLRPGKTSQAIEVVERENSVIELEQTNYEYADFTSEKYILASMAQNSFMKESEDLASLIQQHMKNKLEGITKDRGVKQAGFHVLVGATMPNVLVEVGFLSNKKEAQNLSKSYYRRNIAEAIYKAIFEFKLKHEQALLK